MSVTLQTFMSRVEPDLNSGCWLWSGAPAAGNYGCIKFDGRYQKAHRVSWALHNGFMPPSHTKVCHSCDTPPCVNPAHLWLGTQADNVADMVAKGRGRTSPRFGSQNAVSVLDETRVWEIKQLVALKQFSGNEVARSYGVSPMTVSRIVNCQTWPHVHMNWPFPPHPLYFPERKVA